MRLVGTVTQGDRLVEDLTGTFRVVREPDEELRLVSVLPIPGEVPPGELLTIAVEVVNDFNRELSRELVLKVDGVPILTRVVTVGANQTVIETFEFAAPLGVGRHELEIDGIKQTFNVVIPPGEAILNLIPPLVIFPDTVEPGEPVSIRATMRNSGDESGPTEVILRINGQEEDRQRVTVPAGGDVAVTFSVTRDTEDSYRVQAPSARDVKTLTGTFTVARVEPPVGEPILNLVPPLDILPSQVRPGDPVIVAARLRNTGKEDGRM